MVYWMNKFNNASPWPLPKPIPSDGFVLAKLAVERMCSVDQTSHITIFNTKDVSDAIDHTWIVSGQSIHQRELLLKQPSDKPIKVEGPFRIYLREQSVNYFVLKADYQPPPQVEEIDVDGELLSVKFVWLIFLRDFIFKNTLFEKLQYYSCAIFEIY